MTRPTLAMLAALAVAATACSDSGTGPTGDPLTLVEANLLAGSVALATYDVTAEGMTVVAEEGGGTGAGTITVDHQATHPCPVDGTVAVDVDLTVQYDEQAQSFDLTASGSLAHDGCAFAHNQVTFALDGDPHLAIGMHAAAANGMPVGEWTSSIDGAFLWSASDGRSGRCIIDIASITDFAAGSRTVSGQACGHTVQQTVDWDAAAARAAARLY